MSVELTKQAICNSFIKLLNQKPLDKIHVKDIVEDCGINRNTFYYHYSDIYELTKDIFERETLKTIKKNNSITKWQDGVLDSIEFALNNKKAIYHIYNSVSREQLERYLLCVVHRIMEQVIAAKSKGLKVNETDIHYVTLFYEHAIVGIIMDWLQNNMKGEPELAIKEIGRIFDGNIKFTLEKISE